MPPVYDNRNERVMITITPEDSLLVFVGNSVGEGLPATFTIDVPTAEDLLEGLAQAVQHVKMKRKSTDGY